MKRYESEKLWSMGPVDGFMIHTPDDRELKDTHPQTIVKELNRMADRIQRLEEELMDAKNKHAVLVADVVLNEDRGERIKRLEDRIHRASIAFFRDGSDGQVASGMLAILEEERNKR